MNILFITELEPFPPNRGERIRSYNLINSILEFADNLILIAGNAPPKEKRYASIEYLKYPGKPTRNRWINLLYLFMRRRSFTRLLNGILSAHQINMVFIDFNFFGNYIQVFKNRGIRVTYGTHNIQSYLNYQRPVKGLKEHLYLHTEFFFEKLHERIFFKQADHLIGVSDEDLNYYRKRLKLSRTYLVPNYINENEYLGYCDAEKKQQIIMTGNFNTFQNYYGLRWFLENVWDKELAELAGLVIVGHGSKEQFQLICQDGIYSSSITAMGSVDNLKGHIAESKAAIIPLQHGSGTRLKCIEAMALKTNIVSTSVGVEGIKHDGSILIADDALSFKECLIRVLKNEIKNEEKAYQVFLSEYSFQANTPRLQRVLKS